MYVLCSTGTVNSCRQPGKVGSLEFHTWILRKSQSWRSPHLELSLHIPSNLDVWNTTCLLGKPIFRGYVRFIKGFLWRLKRQIKFVDPCHVDSSAPARNCIHALHDEQHGFVDPKRSTAGLCRSRCNLPGCWGFNHKATRKLEVWHVTWKLGLYQVPW